MGWPPPQFWEATPMEVLGAEQAYVKANVSSASGAEEVEKDFKHGYHANPDGGEAQRRRRLWGTVPLKERKRINALPKEKRTKAKAEIYNEEVTYG